MRNRNLRRERALIITHADKVAGMFLYAKLMMLVISAHGFPADMEREIENLPEGLEQA